MKLNNISDSTLGTAGTVTPFDGASRSGLHTSAPNVAETRATTSGLLDALYGVQKPTPKRFICEDHYCYINGQPVGVDYDYADDTGVDVTVHANCPTCDTDPYCDPVATWRHEDDNDCNQFAVCDCGYKTQVFSIYAMLRGGKFVEPVRVGAAVLWRESDVDAWIRSLSNVNLAPPASDTPSPRSSRAARSAPSAPAALSARCR